MNNFLPPFRQISAEPSTNWSETTLATCPRRVGAVFEPHHRSHAGGRRPYPDLDGRGGARIFAESPGRGRAFRKTGRGAAGLRCYAARGLACPHPPLTPVYKMAGADETRGESCFFANPPGKACAGFWALRNANAKSFNASSWAMRKTRWRPVWTFPPIPCGGTWNAFIRNCTSTRGLR